jgi:hypothetical protein
VSVLLLYVGRDRLRGATVRHLAALRSIRGHVLSFDASGPAASRLRRLEPEAILLHTTLLCMRWSPTFYEWKRGLDWISHFRGPKLAFPQDDYDHAEILDEWLSELGVTAVLTPLPDHAQTFYPLTAERARIEPVLTGYVDDDAAAAVRPRLRPLAGRPTDVVYRALELPYWFGSHGRLKHRIGVEVVERASSHGLSVDISTRREDTIYGPGWFDFLAGGRATIGSESGSSVLDRRGEVRSRIEWMLAGQPELAFEDVAARMPGRWDDHSFFALSPRHLEAAAARTPQLLVSGRYGGVLEPERHYVPVAPDLSDLDDALDSLRDLPRLECIADRAYADLIESGRYSYRRLTELVETVLRDPDRVSRRGHRVGAGAAGALAVHSATNRLLGLPARLLRTPRHEVRPKLAAAVRRLARR